MIACLALCLLISELLSKHGHEVTAVENGQLAWDLYSSHPVPLLISDWMMPVMDGLELCRRIRSEKRANYTYIILLTALSGKANYLEGMEAGADDFVEKPFDADELQARLRAAERILLCSRRFASFAVCCRFALTARRFATTGTSGRNWSSTLASVQGPCSLTAFARTATTRK